VAQVLHLMNAPEVQAIEPCRRGAGENGQAPSGRRALVEELYLTFFARFPDEREKKIVLVYLAENKCEGPRAVEDVAWGLLNSLEFGLNH